ncbi:MAG: hypothetical protein A3J93_02620 [Candidatus Magasanikbacteria bacterium RIFOXYC2_FULL_42_28]|uniref:Uncharacterized protein n=1 Tax=Candidatus Magasanikbacteria bacterium RIFOXYC2_FULL_42_28 TaxID=1798704 RepID=A0A1F6NVS0_9BACT|nr:MAG: hypothetical protein A3J93_02620 [Candidatus Magasanikbacteria bacterium RIFOXYC2_FULL_42_28]
MHELSIKKYASLCLFGGEIAYTVCMVYGKFLSGAAAELHASLFALFPGFTGVNFGSWFFGALTVAVWSGVAGAYVAWMHNVSIKK